MGGGYQKPSGVFYSEMEPMRFLRLINFVNFNVQSTDKLLALSGISQFDTDNILSQSAFRFKYYHYDEWQSRMLALSGVSNVASGMLDWMRNEEPLYWYYYDLGGSGNFTRRIIKNVGFPYDDISTIPSGDNPLNYSFPLINSSGNRILEGASILLPFYQSAGLIEQIQSAFSGMFANQITNSAHPLDVSLSGIPVPAIGRNIALQLNNLNLQVSDFINEYGSPKLNNSGTINFPLNIVPGSGFQPILDMAQQINYPKEYISNINAIVPFIFNPTSQPNTDCTHYGNEIANYSKADYLISYLYFGFMQPSSINIQFSGTLPTYTAIGNEYDRFGNSRAAVNLFIYPVVTAELHEYVSVDTATVGSIIDNAIYSRAFSAISDNQSYTIFVSGNQVGYNSFSRYYDPLADSNSNYGQDQFSTINPTSNYYIKNTIGWLAQFSGGGACLNTSDVYFSSIPYLSLDTANFQLSINDIDIPFTKYNDARFSGSRSVGYTNGITPQCFQILGGSTITINYTMPAITCKGYQYRLGQAIANPGASNGSINCSQFTQNGTINICTPETFLRASKFGWCCVNNFIGSCQNVNDIGPAFATNDCSAPIPVPIDCYSSFIPNPIAFVIKNGCGESLFSASLDGSAPPVGVYNVWTDVDLSETFNINLVGISQYLNSWQNLTGYMTLTTESECVSLNLQTDSIGFPIGCFKNYPAGQKIETHPALVIQTNSLDSNDLTIYDMITGGNCNGIVNSNDNTNGTCHSPYGYIASLGGKTVNIKSIECNFIIQCSDGTTQNLSFSLPGNSASYLLDSQTGCAFANPSFTASWGMGSAPAGCGWW